MASNSDRPWHYCALLLAALAALASFPGAAAEIEDEVSGFVLDRTITRVGHDFAKHLSNFRNMRSLGDYNLTVYERPSARWGNMIWVEQDQKRVFQTFLFPSSSRVRAVAEQAADQIHQEVQRQQLQSLFLKNEDLAGDEF